MGLFQGNRNLHGRCGGKSQMNHINAQAGECTDDQLGDHRARNAGIPANNDADAFGTLIVIDDPGTVGSRKFNDINGAKAFARFSAYRTTNSRNRFNQSHSLYLCFKLAKILFWKENPLKPRADLSTSQTVDILIRFGAYSEYAPHLFLTFAQAVQNIYNLVSKIPFKCY